MSEAQNIHPEIKHAIVEFSEIYKRLLALENDPEYRKFVDTPRKIVYIDEDHMSIVLDENEKV